MIVLQKINNTIVNFKFLIHKIFLLIMSPLKLFHALSINITALRNMTLFEPK